MPHCPSGCAREQPKMRISLIVAHYEIHHRRAAAAFLFAVCATKSSFMIELRFGSEEEERRLASRLPEIFVVRRWTGKWGSQVLIRYW